MHLLAFGDVTSDTPKPGGLTAGVSYQRDRCFNEPLAPVLSDNLPIECLGGFSGAIDPVKGLINFPGIFLIHILAVIHTHYFIFGISKIHA